MSKEEKTFVICPIVRRVRNTCSYNKTNCYIIVIIYINIIIIIIIMIIFSLFLHEIYVFFFFSSWFGPLWDTLQTIDRYMFENV